MNPDSGTTTATSPNPETVTNEKVSPQKLNQGISTDVADFHRSSRLHFLGTWRERFERWKLDSESAGNPITFNAKLGPPSNLWAYCDMDAFFVSVATRNWPEDVRDRTPAAVVSG